MTTHYREELIALAWKFLLDLTTAYLSDFSHIFLPFDYQALETCFGCFTFFSPFTLSKYFPSQALRTWCCHALSASILSHYSYVNSNVTHLRENTLLSSVKKDSQD